MTQSIELTVRIYSSLVNRGIDVLGATNSLFIDTIYLFIYRLLGLSVTNLDNCEQLS